MSSACCAIRDGKPVSTSLAECLLQYQIVDDGLNEGEMTSRNVNQVGC